MTTDQILARFEQEYQRYNGISADRARRQLKLLREFEAHAKVPLITAGADHLRDFMSHLSGRGDHPNTVRRKGNMVKPFFTWAFDARLVPAETLLEVRRVKDPRGATDRSLPRPYKRHELDAFWAALDKRWALNDRIDHWLSRWHRGLSPWRRCWRHGMRLQIEAIIHLALYCGLRRNEIYYCDINDLHYDNDFIVVRGKGGKVREVPFHSAARAAVKAWLNFRTEVGPKHDFPWLSLHGNTRAKPMLHSRFSSLLIDCVGPYELHRFRHTCGTEWLRAGVEIHLVKKLLGHSDIRETEGYAEVVKSDVAKAMGACEDKFSTAVRVLNGSQEEGGMNSTELVVTIAPVGDKLEAEVRCPAFVDHRTCVSVEQALVWAQERCEGKDPFEEYQD